jgi:hypothetical protein
VTSPSHLLAAAPRDPRLPDPSDLAMPEEIAAIDHLQSQRVRIIDLDQSILSIFMIVIN